MNEIDSQDSEIPRETDIKNVAKNIVKELEENSPEILANVPPEEKIKIVEGVMEHCAQELSYSYVYRHIGPLPAPESLQKYGDIVENGAERIMRVFEKQTTHRQEIEKTVTKRQLNQSATGQIFAFIIGVFCVVAGCYLVINEHDGAGIALFSIDIVGLASVFIYGRYTKIKSSKKD